IRIGTPDDYADRFLPEIMARFARSNPRVELTVTCEPTPGLVEHIKRGNLDLALVTHSDAHGQSEVVRREPLLWVTSANHATHEQDVLPMAFGRPNCIWRRAAVDVLDRQNRDYRILFTSFSATVITAAVLSGLAISVLPECAL
ncbi:MAG: LysR family transcriptional regulator, partial [Mesorhizobium sp.]